MTREKALEVSNLLFKIERYEAIIEEILGLKGLEELAKVYGETDIEAEMTGVVQVKLDKLLKELESINDISLTENSKEEILKEALEYFAGMHGFHLEKNDYDGEVEYSCNGYVVDEDTFKTLSQAKELTGWWDNDEY